MRNAMTMNDYMEIEYGLNCLRQAYTSESGQSFQQSLDICFPGISEEIKNHFNAWIPGIKRDTFITCFSEHVAEEDGIGRLSLWRAYGGRSGVALIFNNGPMFLPTQALAAYSNPVAYFTLPRVEEELRKIGEAITAEKDFICQLGRDRVRHIVFQMYRFAILCNKHPGFHEEKEWRVISSPVIQSSELITQDVEVVRGVPQTVLKVPLRDYPEQNVVGLEIPQFLDRIIIGPCEFPAVIYRALVTLLDEAGVVEPETKVFVSDIPLRHFN